ncbi:MAG: host attachment protein [Planctomycetota bacterium]
MSPTLVLAANRCTAFLYSYDPKGEGLTLLDEQQHPAGRAKDADLETDRPHQSFDRYGQGQRAMAQEQRPSSHEDRAWARQLADQLRQRRSAAPVDSLVLVAEPGFLGLLGDALDRPTAALVTTRIPKDIGNEPADRSRERLQGWLHDAVAHLER